MKMLLQDFNFRANEKFKKIKRNKTLKVALN